MNSRPQKIIMLGETDVGKTAILQTHLNKKYPQKTNSTLGACFHRDSYVDAEGDKVTMDLWDTAGQQRYRSLLSLYYKNSDGVIITFDLSNQNTFDAVKYWTTQLQQNCEDFPCVILVGNKSDLLAKGQKPKNQKIINKFLLGKNDWKYIVCSAKQNLNITNIFTTLSLMIKKRLKQQKKSKLDARSSRKKIYGTSIYSTNSGKKDSCC